MSDAPRTTQEYLERQVCEWWGNLDRKGRITAYLLMEHESNV